MNLSDVEQIFLSSSPESQKRFLKRNMKKLAKRDLLGKFYRLYAQKNNPKPIKKSDEDDPYKVLFEPLAHR